MYIDRTRLSSTQLYELATRQEIVLTQAERDRMNPDLLFVLAITNKLRITQHDREHLRVIHLAHLAILEKIELTHDDKRRLPTESLFELFVGGFTDLSAEEMARFSAEQLHYIDEIEGVSAAISVVGCRPRRRYRCSSSSLPRGLVGAYGRAVLALRRMIRRRPARPPMRHVVGCSPTNSCQIVPKRGWHAFCFKFAPLVF